MSANVVVVSLRGNMVKLSIKCYRSCRQIHIEASYVLHEVPPWISTSDSSPMMDGPSRIEADFDNQLVVLLMAGCEFSMPPEL